MLRLELLHPAVKACTVVLCALGLALFFDPWTPLLFMLWTWSIAAMLGRIPWRKWIRFLPPFLLFAFGYFWTVLIFSEASENAVVWWEWGWIEVTEDGFRKGLSLGLRVLAFASLSFLFIFTTDPVQFIYSLMRQGRLSPKLAYGILAGYRFMPSFLDELAVMRKAHRVRGADQARGLRGGVQRIGRYAIPLLASAIRKAERTAMAMESKGFTGDRNRTYYYDMKITYQDWVFMAVMGLGLAVSIAASWKMGALSLYHIRL